MDARHQIDGMIRIFLAFCLLQGSLTAQESAKDLPELEAFLRNIRANLRSDRLLQSQYTFNLKETEIYLDKQGNTKKTQIDEYEVYPSLEEGLTYLRHISRDGKPLSPEEIEKQDRKADGKVRKRERELQKAGLDEKAERLAREAEEKRKEDLAIDELFRLYDISMVRRDVIEGHPAILLEFRPRPGYKPSTREGKMLAKIAGRAWFCEEDYQVIKIEVELVDTLSFGLGVLARLNKGAKGVLLRRRVNNEIWLPAEARFSGTVRLLLLKGIRLQANSEFSNYKKFSVNTSIRYRIQ